MRNAQKDLELCSKATPGPWTFREELTVRSFRSPGKHGQKSNSICNTYCTSRSKEENVVNACFIAESREALPYWIREFENQKTQLKIAKLYLKHALLIIEAEEIGRTPNWEFWSREVEDFLGGIANE